MFLFLGLNYLVSAQDGITFKVEDLSKPDSLLPTTETVTLLKDLIVRKSDLKRAVVKNEIQIGPEIIAHCKLDDCLANLGLHPFLYGIQSAYNNHYPVVLSPDMIWLLISQGFAQHINANPEKYRKQFVDFEGKKVLRIESDAASLKDIDWEYHIELFSKKIGENTKDDIAKTLTADFSTTTSVEKIASQITLMNAMQSYFVYLDSYAGCGIPEITLTGTTKDWEKIYDKAKTLKNYDLAWWIDEIEPILKQFIKTTKGKVDTEFWMNMYKVHTLEEYGTPRILNGWMIKFFPYDRNNNKNNMDWMNERDIADLPSEILQVDVVTHNKTTGKIQTVKLWAGFIGDEQNKETFAITPKIGWFVQPVDPIIEAESIKHNPFTTLVVSELPCSMKYIDSLWLFSVQFTDSIHFQDWAKDICFGRLKISGKIAPKEKAKIVKWYPDTELTINGIEYITTQGGLEINPQGYDIREAIDGIDSVTILSIYNVKDCSFCARHPKFCLKHPKFGKKHWGTYMVTNVIIPDTVTTKIDTIKLSCYPKEEDIEKLKNAFPDSKILYHSYSFPEGYIDIDIKPKYRF